MGENDPVERVMRLCVYGPLGFAAYLRDSAPSFMELFVARGRREFDGARRTVEQRLGMGEPEPAPAPALPQRVADGLGRFAAQAGSMVAAVAGPVVDAAAGTVTAATSSAPGAANGATRGTNGAAAPPSHGLPIPEYDGLSASQVIERLDGLSRGALERIRVYELAHRARRTILASIDQLTA